jgi:hypothetical protein
MIDPKTAFLNSHISQNNPFYQEVIYTPYGGVAKTIGAIVLRDRLDKQLHRNTIPQVAFRVNILISVDATSGVSEVNVNRDTVTMDSPEHGDTSHVYKVGNILQKSFMAWVLELKA